MHANKIRDPRYEFLVCMYIVVTGDGGKILSLRSGHRTSPGEPVVH